MWTNNSTTFTRAHTLRRWFSAHVQHYFLFFQLRNVKWNISESRRYRIIIIGSTSAHNARETQLEFLVIFSHSHNFWVSIRSCRYKLTTASMRKQINTNWMVIDDISVCVALSSSLIHFCRISPKLANKWIARIAKSLIAIAVNIWCGFSTVRN